MSVCVLFVCNNKYINKFQNTLNMLRTNGKYEGEVVLIIGNDLKEESEKLNEKYNIQTIYFADFYFDKNFIDESFLKDKLFQYHKFHIFDEFFKRWNYILYLDCGIKIFRPIEPILKSYKKDMTTNARRRGRRKRMVPMVFETGVRPSDEAVNFVRSYGAGLEDADRSELLSRI